MTQPTSLVPAGGAASFSRSRKETAMFIILTGDPSTGFTTVGPYVAACEAEDDGDNARNEYGGSDWWVLPLHLPDDPGGRFVVFSGDIESAFTFTGPFSDEATARSYGRPLVPNIVMELQPPSEEAEEAA
jgi:hypothetical protein